jgi:hypothetical protein
MNKHRIPKFAVVAACILLALALIIPNINNVFKLNTPFIQSENPGGGQPISGVAMFPYYRCNGSYYALQGRMAPSLQNDISKRIYGQLYEINGVDPSKSIALFINQYYYQLDYVFSDTITFMGKTYLIFASSTYDGNDLNHLGNAGQYSIYEIPGIDISNTIAVQIGNLLHPHYSYAYQYPSTVNINGVTYELGLMKYNISENKSEGDYLGMAGQYKAYSYKDTSNGKLITIGPKTISVHISDTEEVEATDISTPDNSPIPTSRYGPAVESMFPILSEIHWKNHGFYTYQGKTITGSVNDQLGNILDNISVDGHNYVLYEMKCFDPITYIIVKNNEVYLKYRFMFTDTIIFNGRTYLIRDTTINGNLIRGNKIGQFGSTDIYEFSGIDPAKEICVPMSGPPIPAGEVGGTLGSGDLIAYSE